MKKMIHALLSVAVSLALAMPAGAQVADHLQCFRIEDALAKTSYTVTLTPTDPNFPAAAGCTIKVPAKMRRRDEDERRRHPTAGTRRRRGDG